MKHFYLGLITLAAFLVLTACMAPTVDEGLPSATPLQEPSRTPTPGGIRPSTDVTTTPTPVPRVVVTETPTAEPGPADGSDDPALAWHREGGIAGFCDDLTIYADGSYVAETCKAGRPVLGNHLTAEQMERFSDWLRDLAPFEYSHKDGAVADAMTLQLTFNGRGSRQVDQGDRNALMAFAGEVFAQAGQKADSGSRDDVSIYSAVVRQVYMVDHTFGQPPNFPVIYLLRYTDDSAGDPGSGRSDPQFIDEAQQQAIAAAVSDLPARLVWVDAMGDVPRADYDAVADGGAVIALGNIHEQADGSVHVAASLYVAPLVAGGGTYVLEQQDGAWQIAGRVGPIWMS